MLIYGTTDMKTKIFEQKNADRKKGRKAKVSDSEHTQKGKEESGKNEKKNWKELFLWGPKERLLTYFDSWMLIVIAYSCFMSMYFAAFEFDIKNPTIFWLENICTFFFVVEQITHFMRVPENNNNSDVKITHTEIAKRYFKRGQWIYEWAATLPLYLI